MNINPRRSGDKSPRPLRLIPALRRTLATILPDQPRVAALVVALPVLLKGGRRI